MNLETVVAGHGGLLSATGEGNSLVTNSDHSSLVAACSQNSSLVTACNPNNSLVTVCNQNNSLQNSLVTADSSGEGATAGGSSSMISVETTGGGSSLMSGGGDDSVDHVDGHTLSTVPLTAVGCADTTLLTNLFQDTVTEGFIDFAEINGQQGVLTPVSSVFPSSVFSTSSPQYPSTAAGVANSTNYSVLRTPVYSSGADSTPVYSRGGAGSTPVYSSGGADSTSVFADTDSTTVFAAGNSIEFPAGEEFSTSASHVYTDIVRELDVQDLECISIQQIKSAELPRAHNPPVDTTRLEVVWSTWAGELRTQLETGAFRDLNIRCKHSSASGFQDVPCHRLILAMSSPLINSWLKDIENSEDSACLIFPDFTSSEVEQFLDLLYLRCSQPTSAFNSVMRCLSGENARDKLAGLQELSSNPQAASSGGQHVSSLSAAIKNDLLQSQVSTGGLTMSLSDKKTYPVPSSLSQVTGSGLMMPDKKDCKMEDKEDKINTLSAQVEIKMEEFEKLEQDKLLSVKLQNVQMISVGNNLAQDNSMFGQARKPAKTDELNPLIQPVTAPASGAGIAGVNKVDKVLTSNNSSMTSSSVKPPAGDNKDLTCNVCHKVFKMKRILKEHMQRHGEPKFTCEQDGCGKKFFTQSNMKCHVDRVHLNKRTIPCDVCGKLFYNRCVLKEHMSSHETRQLQCPHCPFTVKTKKTLNMHIRSKHGDETSICYVCHKSLSDYASLRVHINRVHFKKKRFMCNKCGKTFFEKHKWLVHQQCHDQEGRQNNKDESLRCSICSVLLKNMKSLRDHLQYKHRDPDPKHVCHQCGKAFKKSYHLNRHMNLHKRISYTCSLCSKVFKSQVKYDSHMNSTHPGSKIVADQQIKLDNDVATVHTASKGLAQNSSNKCQHCGKMFGDNPVISQVQEHYRTCEVRNFMVDAT